MSLLVKLGLVLALSHFVSSGRDASGFSFIDERSNELSLIVTLQEGRTTLPRSFLRKFPGIEAIYLNGTGLSTLDAEAFTGQEFLLRIFLNDNNLKTLPKTIFIGLDKLWQINLENNTLMYLPLGIFSNLTSLRFLSLSDNKLTELHPDIFRNLHSLWSLSLKGNKLNLNDSALLEDLSSLFFLYLDDNGLTTLPDDIFNCLNALTHVSLKNNRLTQLSCKLFAGSNSLKYISLSKNTFQRFNDDKCIDRNSPLKNLDLSNNSMTYLDPGPFSFLTELRYLNLDDNFIAELRKDIFLSLTKLEVFSMKRNQMLSFDLTLMQQTTKHVDLQDNNIRQLFCSNTYFAANLEILTLAGNNLHELPNCLFSLSHIITLDLSRNNLDITLFQDADRGLQERNDRLTYAHIIDLGYNNFTSLKLEGSEEKTNLRDLLESTGILLTGNNLSCDCNALSLHQILSDVYKLRRSALDRRFLQSWYCGDKSEELVMVKSSRLWCENKNLPGCPGGCLCSSSLNSVAVNCSHLQLKELPREVPTNTTVLIMDQNHITTLKYRDYLTNLTCLSLRRNKINKIHSKAIANLRNLKELYLMGNSLEGLPHSFTKLSIEKISLSENRFSCDCYGRWTNGWILKNNDFVIDIEKIYCRDGGPPYLDLYPDDFVCRLTPSQIGLVVLGIIVVLMIISAFLICYYHREIKVFIFTRFRWHPFDKASDSDIRYKLYDATVGYSVEDKGWVINTMMPKLESPNMPHRLCLYDRDFLPGIRITRNILHSIKYSRRMILCLTNNFLKNEWCMFEFFMAHRQVLKGSSQYLILILFDHIKFEDLNVELRAYLRTNTYLHYTDSRFWEKLFYAMPEEPLLTLRRERFPSSGFEFLPPSALSLSKIPNSGISSQEIESRALDEERELE